MRAGEKAAERLKTEIDPREFDSPEYRKDPFPVYKRLRDHRPLFRDGFHGRWVLSRYDDIVAVFQDNEHYDRATYNPDGPYRFGERSVFGPNILEYGNSQRHRWMRNIVADQFVGNRLQAFIPVIEMIARELLDKIAEKAADDIAKGFAGTGEVELVSEFTSQFPVRVISNMLGLPRHDEDTFVSWYQRLISGMGSGQYYVDGIHARDEIWDYLEPIIEERMKNPGEDLVSRIVSAELQGKRMNVEEVKGFVALLLAAGGDTTDKAIANMWYHMLYTRP
ncbi:MAG: cytochrome P450, partial [Dehalococcoidia bacterium]|nr:cytochrome P450 [Dehalococcoidia bacterium]